MIAKLMFILDALRLAMKSLSERRLRAMLTIVGIAIGPLTFVTMTSVVGGYSDYVLSKLESLGQNLIVVYPSNDYRLSDVDIDTLSTIEGVEGVTPFYATKGTIKLMGSTHDVYVYATNLDLVFSAIKSLELLEGHIPSESEVVGAVVGYNIAFKDGKQVLKLGDVITITLYNVKPGGGYTIKRVSFVVVGILKQYGGALILNPDDTIFLNLRAGKRLLGLKEWSGIIVVAKSSTVVTNIVKEIKSIYRESVSVISFQGIARIISSVTGAMDFIAFSTSLSAFAVAVAGVAATMITSVIERVREIGVMKAVGFTNGQVLIMILCEALLMSFIGLVIGISLGIIGAHILASRGFTISSGTTKIFIVANPKITLEGLTKVSLITIGVGILGGVFPAYKAAKIPPAVALRYE